MFTLLFVRIQLRIRFRFAILPEEATFIIISGRLMDEAQASMEAVMFMTSAQTCRREV